jgi:lipopolysaccharide transport system permease protein
MELRAGLLPWSFFATAVIYASNSLIGNANLISKVYFPRLIVPIAAVMVAFVDFLISFAILVALMIRYQFMPGWQILLLGVPDQWRLVYSLNPKVGVIDGFRGCLIGGENELYLPGLWLSLAVTGFFVWFGIRQFRKVEKSFADLI